MKQMLTILFLTFLACKAYAWYGVSPYAYCAGDPVNNVDPDGMDVWDINDEGRIITRQKDTCGFILKYKLFMVVMYPK